jgi:hypothetical protein
LFIAQILEQTNVSTHTVLASLFLVKKLSNVIEFDGLAGSEFRLWTTALLITNAYFEVCKFKYFNNQDNAFTAKSFSEVSNIPLKEIVVMKMDFLELIAYEISIPQAEYHSWLSVLDTQYAGLSIGISTLYPMVPTVARMPSPPYSYPKECGSMPRRQMMYTPPSPPKRYLSKERFQLLM